MTKQMKKLAVEEIYTDQVNQPRQKVKTDDLVQSIKTIGLLSPISVVQTDKGYRVLDGHRRLAAFAQARPGELIDALVYEDESINEYVHALASNVQRHQLNEQEIKEYTQLRLLDVEPEYIAAATGMELEKAQKLSSARKSSSSYGYDLGFDALMFLAERDNDEDVAKLLSESDTSKGITWNLRKEADYIFNSRKTRARAAELGVRVYEEDDENLPEGRSYGYWEDKKHIEYDLDDPCGCDEFAIELSWIGEDIGFCGNPSNHPERPLRKLNVELTDEQKELLAWTNKHADGCKQRIEIIKQALANATFNELVPSDIVDSAINILACNYGSATKTNYSLSRPGELVIAAVDEAEDNLIKNVFRRSFYGGDPTAETFIAYVANYSSPTRIPRMLKYLRAVQEIWPMLEAYHGPLESEKALLLEAAGTLESLNAVLVKKAGDDDDE